MCDNIFKQVGSNIQNVLSEQGKTQQYLADELGVSKQVMSKIINGTKAINVAEIRAIASILDVSSECLLSVKSVQREEHHFAFMGRVKSEDTKEKIEFLKHVIEEMIFLEEYADA